MHDAALVPAVVLHVGHAQGTLDVVLTLFGVALSGAGLGVAVLVLPRRLLLRNHGRRKRV